MNKENLYDFIESKAIREHLVKIKYDFKPDEATFIVWHSRRTIADKIGAWQWIADNMENVKLCENKSYMNEIYLYDFIEQYISGLNQLMLLGKTSDNDSVYTYKVYQKEYDDMYDGDGIFKSYNDCFISIEQPNELIRIKKEWLQTDECINKYIEFELLPDGQIINIYSCNVMDDAFNNLINIFEDEMCYVIPTPFKKGDILASTAIVKKDSEPFVLDCITYWDMTDKEIDNIKKGGWSYIDMAVWGFYQRTDGPLYHECMHDYLSLDYYDSELEDRKRILKTLSNFFKDKINADLLVNAYHIFTLEDELREHRAYLDYIDEWLDNAALK